MNEAIYTALKPVRSRQQKVFAVRSTVAGLIVGAAAGLTLGVVRLATGWQMHWGVGVAVLAAGPVLGLLAGLLLRRGWHDAAAAVDGHYRLKDRSVTALAFSQQTAPTELQAVQIGDAIGHMRTVEPKAVVPLKATSAWPIAAVALAAAVVVLAWPLPPRETQAGPAPVPENILAVAAEQKAKIPEFQKKLSETAQDTQDEKNDEQKAFEKQLEKDAQKLEELNQAGTDQKEALAKLSELQAAWQSLANELNTAACVWGWPSPPIAPYAMTRPSRSTARAGLRV